jgi:hypothetical protein
VREKEARTIRLFLANGKSGPWLTGSGKRKIVAEDRPLPILSLPPPMLQPPRIQKWEIPGMPVLEAASAKLAKGEPLPDAGSFLPEPPGVNATS